MRVALLAGVILASVPTPGLAQTGPYLATVTDPEAKLRAGPSAEYAETATLPRGAQVLVDHEEPNGWLAVQDPPGKLYSLSWVQASFVDFDNTRPIPQNVVVDEDNPISLAAGQIGLAQPLTNYRRTKVPGGTILTVIGAKVQFDGKWWHPVVPPAGDFRYLPKQVVRYDKTVNNTFLVRDTNPNPTPPVITPVSANNPTGLPPAIPPTSLPPTSLPPATVPSPPVVVGPPTVPTTTASKPAVNHPLWIQAEAAERDGRLDDAEKLYFQLARVMNEPGGDHDVANLCYTRIHAIREKKRGDQSSTTGGSSNLPRLPGDPTRQAGGNSPGGSGTLPTSTGALGDDRPKWSGPGKLVRSALALDGRRTYALESNPGVTVLYVVANQGSDLEQYVGRRVEVYGVSATRRGLSKPFVVATGVELAQ